MTEQNDNAPSGPVDRPWKAIFLIVALVFAGFLAPSEAQLSFVELHGPDRQIIFVNPQEVTSIREPRNYPGHFAKGTRCLLFVSNGNFIAVTDPCDFVRTRLEHPVPPETN